MNSKCYSIRACRSAGRAGRHPLCMGKLRYKLTQASHFGILTALKRPASTLRAPQRWLDHLGRRWRQNSPTGQTETAERDLRDVSRPVAGRSWRLNRTSIPSLKAATCRSLGDRTRFRRDSGDKPTNRIRLSGRICESSNCVSAVSQKDHLRFPGPMHPVR